MLGDELQELHCLDGLLQQQLLLLLLLQGLQQAANDTQQGLLLNWGFNNQST